MRGEARLEVLRLRCPDPCILLEEISRHVGSVLRAACPIGVCLPSRLAWAAGVFLEWTYGDVNEVRFIDHCAMTVFIQLH